MAIDSSKIDLLLPAELYDIVHESLAAKFSNISYSRVILPLSALLTGDFFTEYIKKGVRLNLLGASLTLLGQEMS